MLLKYRLVRKQVKDYFFNVLSIFVTSLEMLIFPEVFELVSSVSNLFARVRPAIINALFLSH